MGAIDNFLRRFGYAKLDRYGLILTGDDRVLSSRPAVLDDGLGSKIVGWLDGDLAAMELEHWGAARKAAPAKPVAAPRSLQPAPLAAQVIAPAAKLPGVAPVPAAAPAVASPPKLPGVSPFAETMQAPVRAAPAPIAAPALAPVPIIAAPAPAPVVAAEPELTEDEWEWEIAMARVRAAALDVEEAASSAASSFTAPKRKTSPGFTAIAPPVAAAPKRSMPAPVAPIAASKFDERTVEMPKLDERKTVIPVPQLPVAARPSDVRPAPRPSQPPRRMPKGTARIEDTVRTQAAPPANDDHTSPYVTLPPEVKPVGYAHTKRVAAKHQ